MPKVSEEYREEKKKQILDSTLRICQRKTLLAINMQDIINESGLSQGNIYRYYHDLDEILAALLSNLRKEATLIPELDRIFEDDSNFDVTLTRIMELLGTFLENGMNTYCKLDFEFNSMSMNFPERAKHIMEYTNQNSVSNLGYLMTKTMQHFGEACKQQKVQLHINQDALFSFISASYEGIQMTALQSFYGNPILPWETYRPLNQLATLGLTIRSFIDLCP